MLRHAEVSLLSVAVCVAASAAASPEAPAFPVLEGTYVSDVEGGCELELRPDASFTMSCRTLPPCTGRTVTQGREVGVLCAGRPPGRDFLPFRFDRPPQGNHGIVLGFPSLPDDWAGPNAPSPTAWPPPAGDPTRGPYVSGGGGPGESFWLQPVRWGDRLYLVRSGEHQAFCRSVARGLEPRTTAAGHHFLRRGDHRKRCGTPRPDFCAGVSRASTPKGRAQ